MKLIELTDAELQNVARPCTETPCGWRPQGGRPVVVDFYVPWCKPCQAMAPILEEVADEYAGRVDFYRVNIDKERRVAVRFKVRHVPAVVFTPLEGACRLEVGAMTKAALRAAVDKLLNDKSQPNGTV